MMNEYLLVLLVQWAVLTKFEQFHWSIPIEVASFWYHSVHYQCHQQSMTYTSSVETNPNYVPVCFKEFLLINKKKNAIFGVEEDFHQIVKNFSYFFDNFPQFPSISPKRFIPKFKINSQRWTNICHNQYKKQYLL